HTLAAGGWRISDGRQKDVNDAPTPVHIFRLWLAGDLITHIFAAAKELDFKGVAIPATLAGLLADTRAIYDGIPSPQDTSLFPQDPGCGSASLANVNSCMEDHALTGSGYAWIAAFEYQKLRDPSHWANLARAEIGYALSPMSSQASSTLGGGPCFQSIVPGTNPRNCSGTWADYDLNPGNYRIFGADHGQENPAYGFGVMTGVASACAGLYMANSTCSFTAHEKTVAAKLIAHAQDKSSVDFSGGISCSFNHGALDPSLLCLNFRTGGQEPATVGCDDSRTFPGNEPHPTDFPLKVFYDKRAVAVPGTLFQFDRYCENRTVWAWPYDVQWGPNRKVLYDDLAFEVFKPDVVAPKVSMAVPGNGSVITGDLNFSVYVADDLKVSRVEYYLLPGTTPYFTTTQMPWTMPVTTASGTVDNSYQMYARAYDDAGNSTTSGTVSFTVSNPRVNAGGGAYSDPSGNQWFADYGSNGGFTYGTTAAISGTTTPVLYQSERNSATTLQYQLPVANGLRTVTLKFAEIFWSQPGQRVFDVWINGQKVLASFDIVAAAGGAFRAIDRQFSVNVTNQLVTIQFVPVVERVKISAIQIR